jgi:hypothetical protein
MVDAVTGGSIQAIQQRQLVRPVRLKPMMPEAAFNARRSRPCLRIPTKSAADSGLKSATDSD